MIALEGFFLLNVAMDALILYLALLWLGLGRVRLGRVLAAACLGALYACLAYGPGGGPLRGLPGRLLCGLAMVRVACGALGPRPLGKALGFLLAGAFLSGGAASALALWLPGRALPWALLGGAVSAGVAGHAWLRRGRRTPMACGQLHLRFRGVQLRCQAAVDTGNQALDALSGLPLVVLPYESCRKAFPQLGKPLLPPGMRLTGVRTLGGPGLLPCFQPDLLLFDQREYKAIVAIAPKGMLSMALVPPGFATANQKDSAGRRSL